MRCRLYGGNALGDRKHSPIRRDGHYLERFDNANHPWRQITLTDCTGLELHSVCHDRCTAESGCVLQFNNVRFLVPLPNRIEEPPFWAQALRAKMSETSRPWIITVGRRKKSHLDEPKQHAKEGLESCGVGRSAA